MSVRQRIAAFVLLTLKHCHFTFCNVQLGDGEVWEKVKVVYLWEYSVGNDGEYEAV